MTGALRVEIGGARVIGATQGLDLPAPFGRAEVVLDLAAGQGLFRVHRYRNGRFADGKLLDAESWAGVLESGDALALEAEGVSTILVAEALPDAASDWLPFVVDLVFGIEFARDPDTNAFYRQLSCTKSRYAHALPGPHDMGLDRGRPAVWPDLLTIAPEVPLLPDTFRPAKVFVPLDERDRYKSFTNGGLIVSPFDLAGVPVVNLFTHQLPGVSQLWIHCEPLARISGADGEMLSIDLDGPHAIGWAVISWIRKSGENVVWFESPEALLDRRRFTVGLLHVIAALRARGVLAIAHGHSSGLSRINPVADLIVSGPRRGPLNFPRRNFRSTGFWLPEKGISFDEGAAARSALLLGEFDRVKSLLDDAIATSREGAGVKQSRSRAIIAYCLVLLGRSRLAAETVDAQTTDPLSVVLGSCVLLQSGAEWELAQWMAKAEPAAGLLEIYLPLFAALYAGNDAALDRLTAAVAGPPTRLFIEHLLRAWVLRGRFDEVDRIAEVFGKQYDLPGWHTRRLQAEARLESTDDERAREGLDWLTALVDDPVLPPPHRADVHHNLGVAARRFNNRGEAGNRFRAALAINPYLEASQEQLDELDLTGSTAPTADQAPAPDSDI